MDVVSPSERFDLKLSNRLLKRFQFASTVTFFAGVHVKPLKVVIFPVFVLKFQVTPNEEESTEPEDVFLVSVFAKVQPKLGAASVAPALKRNFSGTT